MKNVAYKTDYGDLKKPEVIYFNQKPMFETKVLSNFLIKPFFNNLKNIVESNTIEWFWNSRTLDHIEDDNFMLTHVLYSQQNERPSRWFSVFEPLLYFLKDQYDYKKLLKVKMNLYVNRREQYEHAKHTDMYNQSNKEIPDGLVTSIFNFTTCDGYTKIGNKKIPSKENELIMFDGRKEHCGSTPTNTKNRVLININVA